MNIQRIELYNREEDLTVRYKQVVQLQRIKGLHRQMHNQTIWTMWRQWKTITIVTIRIIAWQFLRINNFHQLREAQNNCIVRIIMAIRIPSLSLETGTIWLRRSKSLNPIF